jgi:hypothetical protein
VTTIVPDGVVAGVQDADTEVVAVGFSSAAAVRAGVVFGMLKEYGTGTTGPSDGGVPHVRVTEVPDGTVMLLPDTSPVGSVAEAVSTISGP